jgi:hypothetical protein
MLNQGNQERTIDSHRIVWANQILTAIVQTRP